jgi:branched-chain amino acid transport system permease protein
MSLSARGKLAVGTTVAVLAAGLTWVLPGFRLYQLAIAGTLAIAMLGLNVLTGFNGQISLGHGAFVGVGAYTAAILVRDTGMPYLLAVAVAGIVCFVVGCAIGIPALRLPGSSLALVTLGFALALPQVIKKYDALTGGTYGIYLPLDDHFDSPWAALDDDQVRYLVVVGVGALLFLAGWNIVRGRWGLAMMAVRDHPVSAAASGVDPARTKVAAFGVSAGYAGTAGGLQFLVVGSVNPDMLSLAVSFALVTGIVVGGLATVAGPVLGALFVTLLPYVAPRLSPAAPALLNGAVTVLVIIVAPGGIVGLLRAVGRRATGAAPTAALAVSDR